MCGDVIHILSGGRVICSRGITVSLYLCIFIQMFSCVCPQLDVIQVDLDGGSIQIPECVSLVQIPDSILKKGVQALNQVNYTYY